MRNKPLECVLSVCTNSENAVVARRRFVLEPGGTCGAADARYSLEQDSCLSGTAGAH